MDLGFGLGLVGRAGLGAAGGTVSNLGPVLDADPLYSGPTLDASAVITSYRAWVDDPAYARLIGRYRSGGPYMGLQDTTFASIFTMARASTATDFDASGVLNTIAAGNIRQGFDPVTKAPLGWLIEGAATNLIRDPRLELLVAANTPANANPAVSVHPHWSTFGSNGLTAQQVGRGTAPNGMSYVDVRYTGTTTNAFAVLPFDATLAGTSGVIYTQSMWCAIVGGSLANVTGLSLNLRFTGSFGADMAPTLTSTLKRYAVTATSDATATFYPCLTFGMANGAAVDVTLRMAGLQVEANYFASSLILPPVSAPAATTRQADALSIDGSRFQQIFGLGKSVTNAALQSQTLDAAPWIPSNASITANAGTAPDGTTTADKLVESTLAASVHNVAQTATWTAGTAATISIYAKAAERSFIRLSFPGTPFGGAAPNAYFDLTNGAVGGTGNNPNANIVSVGSGWYRCSITGTPTTSSNNSWLLSLSATGSSFTYDGDASGTFGALLWGAQLETTPATLAPNLVTSPESLNSGWTPTRASVTASAAVTAPDATAPVSKIGEDATAAASHNVAFNATLTAGQVYTFSAYLRSAERSMVYLRIGGTAFLAAWFNLATGAVGTVRAGVTASIAPVPNAAGWYKCGVTATADAAGSQAMSIYLADTDNVLTVAAPVAGNGIYAWGAQFVQASAAPAYVPLSALVSSYISTTTAAQTKSGITEGCVIVEVMLPQQSGSASQHLASFTDGTIGGRITLYNGGGGVPYVQSYISAAPAVGAVGGVAASFTPGTPFRAGLAFSGNVVRCCVNGGAIQTTIYAGGLPAGLNQLLFGTPTTGFGTTMNGRVRLARALAYAPSDAELIARTTLGA